MRWVSSQPIFFYFSKKTYAVGTHPFNESPPHMFYLKNKKISQFFEYGKESFLTRDLTDITSCLNVRDLSQCMRIPTIWYVRPAKPQISLRIRTV